MSDTTSITVERSIPAPAKDLFDILSNPHRHTELDGSGFVTGLVHGDRLDHVGQKFTMNMSGDHMGGDYQTDNTVTGYSPNQLLAWQTAARWMRNCWSVRTASSPSCAATCWATTARSIRDSWPGAARCRSGLVGRRSP